MVKIRGGPVFWVFSACLLAASGDLRAAGTFLVPGLTTVAEPEVAPGFLRTEVFSIKPAVGVIDFQEGQGGGRLAKLLAGVTLDLNVTQWINQDWTSLYLGPSTGIIYSHLAQPAEDANLLILPVDLKVGRNFGDKFRFSIHAGGNVLYRSNAVSMNLSSEDSSMESLWKLYPNTGVDLELGLGRNIIVALRPDWTFGMDDTVFAGTLGVGVML